VPSYDVGDRAVTAVERGQPTLADLTTLRLGGPARRMVEVDTESDLVKAVQAVDEAGEPLLVVGGGSNLVVADEGFPGTVVLVRTDGVDAVGDMCGGASVEVAAGTDWEVLVARAQHEGWVGIECLSGIPGSTGATPLQNVGAYGQDVSQTIASVRTWDRLAGSQRTFAAAECGFAYRHSRFKAEPGRYVVLAVTFALKFGNRSTPLTYAELARTVGVEVGQRAPLTDVREAVLALRRSKGMVLDAADHDTWSAGSFFTNPVLDPAKADELPPEAPRFAQPDGSVKTSAAWLIAQAGFAKGHGHGRVRLSTKHTLALTNRGGARTTDLIDLAREIRDGVHDRFGIVLAPEPVTVGFSL
jgi:UDP-N-acetylmuramate dehydrogenase